MEVTQQKLQALQSQLANLQSQLAVFFQIKITFKNHLFSFLTWGKYHLNFFCVDLIEKKFSIRFEKKYK